MFYSISVRDSFTAPVDNLIHVIGALQIILLMDYWLIECSFYYSIEQLYLAYLMVGQVFSKNICAPVG